MVCYEYKKPRDIRYDCPLIKSSMRKKMKKYLFRAWTDNESPSSEEEEHANTINFYLMTLEDEEVQSPDSQYDFTFDELMSAFNESLLKEKNKFFDNNDTLRNEINALSIKCSTLEKEKEIYIDDNGTLSCENINLKKEIEKL